MLRGDGSRGERVHATLEAVDSSSYECVGDDNIGAGIVCNISH
jgi:hypothetical protein